jgi:hypothetical protein
LALIIASLGRAALAAHDAREKAGTPVG